MKVFVTFILFSLFIFGLFVMPAAAQTGCLSGSGILYTNGTGNNFTTNNGISNANSIYCIRSTGSSCNLYLLGLVYIGRGNLVNYSPLPCPIDDHVWIVGLAIGAFGWFRLKNRIH